MWRVILIAAIFISSFFSSTGSQITYSCEEGFNLEGSKCRQVKNSHFECKYYPGLENGGKCMTRAKYCHRDQLMGEISRNLHVLPKCPDDYNYTSDRCERHIDHGIAVERDCPSPYQKKDGRCVRIEPPLQVCPLNSNSAACFVRSYSLNNGECMWGYTKKGNTCEFVPDQDRNKDEKTCGSDDTLDSRMNVCISKQSFAAPIRCDQGQPQSNRCIEILVKPLLEVCPPESGHSVENPLQPRLSCLEGVWRDDLCVDTVNVNPIKTCPTYFRFVSGDDRKCESMFTVNARLELPK